MNAVWINLIAAILRRLFDTALWQHLLTLILAADASDLPGAEKRQWVLNQLHALPESYRQALASVAPWLLNLALEAIVASLRAKAS
ncbi:hypothetical protein [Thiocystis violascens]|uniref:Uncharacterized protein n=1 Tax=Thiocystis violascens (strain ATCC 17096 / DSM 198 / 6111) TaxID=765911 RepID=I3YGV0_THIV6|nr:hypothetical protein [Thiocystis violascens]AFL76218.1 hypothetical protein Thivi_4415 [Thiocystis violascens DSM 198]